jgi:hypothetical protein
MINVFLDSNVWNFLFEPQRQIDLADALPSDKFRLYLTREVELENGAINPSVKPEKAALKAFIAATIANCGIQTDTMFGFGDPNLPGDEQRVGGMGRFASHEDYALTTRQVRIARKRRSTPLYPDEADIGLAARAARTVVLSRDKKRGPLNDARQRGGKVVFLTDFDNSGLSLGDFILQELDALPLASQKPRA